jgi:hypothetical protein
MKRYWLLKQMAQLGFKGLQHQPVDFCNGEELCFLSGTDWILKYHLISFKLKFQRITNKNSRNDFW